MCLATGHHTWRNCYTQWTKTNVPNSLRIQFSSISHTTDSTVDISKSKSCSSPQYYHAYTAPEVRKHSTTYPQLWMEWRQTDAGTSHLNSASNTPNACAPYDQIGTADIIIKKDLMLRLYAYHIRLKIANATWSLYSQASDELLINLTQLIERTRITI